MPFKPGEVYWAVTEDQTRHPVIVVSREALNRGGFLVVVPVTSARFSERRGHQTCVPFARGQFGFLKDCVAQADQIFAIRQEFIDLELGRLGCLDDEHARDLTRAIGHVIDAECEPS
jgi:mRNA-degrading endonuclease toxin of MazEF toxin-antitoxin module